MSDRQEYAKRQDSEKMSEKRYNVPDGMMKAAISRHDAIFPGFVRSHRDIDGISAIVEAVLRYQAENPAVPTNEQAARLTEIYSDTLEPHSERLKIVVKEWQRRAYLVVEPEIPEAIKDLLDPVDQEMNQHVGEC